MWIPRYISSRLQRSVQSRPAVLVSGARQTGKSSLLLREFPDAEYITFDHLRYIEQVREAPESFVRSLSGYSGGQTILDEIQYVPEIFRELKIVIDRQRQGYGRWLLTGSQAFEMMNSISESLAGRISIFQLQTLGAMELRNYLISQNRDFTADSSLHRKKKTATALIDYLWLGGYPELWSNPGLDSGEFFESYIRTYVERDLRALIDIRNLTDFRRFIKIAASRAGQLVNYRDMASDLGVTDMTVRKWLAALQTGGIIYLLPPYFANIGKRLIKTPKLYFADHGLLCYLLEIDGIKAWNKHLQRGAVWENLVFSELIKSCSLIPGRELFFYRDQNGVEIDFVVEKGGMFYLIEAKATERACSGRFNFHKVSPLLEKKGRCHNLAAMNIRENKVMSYRNHRVFNPLFVMPDFST